MSPELKDVLIALGTGFVVLIVWEPIGLGTYVKKYFSRFFSDKKRRWLMNFSGDLNVYISKPQTDTVRESDTFILTELNKYLPTEKSHATERNTKIDFNTLKDNVLVIGSPRYNIIAENIQEYFDIGFEFVFDSYDADPKLKILKIVNKYGDTFTSSKDLKVKGATLSADYGIFTQIYLANGKKIFWVAGIHGIGSIGIVKYILENPKEFVVKEPAHKTNGWGCSWLLRVKYKSKDPIENFENIESVEIISENLDCVARNINKPPQNLIFDFGNVLMFFDRDRTYRALTKYITKSHLEIRKLLEDSSLLNKYERGEIDSQNFYKEVLAILNIKPKDLSYDLFIEIYGDIFWLNKNIFEALKQLKNKVNLAILSNTNEIHFNSASLNYKDIFDLFERKIILSYEVKHLKPEKEIFDKAIRLFGSDSTYTDTIYVDDLKEYVDVANNLGMKGIVYYRYTSFIYSLRKLGVYIP